MIGKTERGRGWEMEGDGRYEPALIYINTIRFLFIHFDFICTFRH